MTLLQHDPTAEVKSVSNLTPLNYPSYGLTGTGNSPSSRFEVLSLSWRHSVFGNTHGVLEAMTILPNRVCVCMCIHALFVLGPSSSCIPRSCDAMHLDTTPLFCFVLFCFLFGWREHVEDVEWLTIHQHKCRQYVVKMRNSHASE